MNFIYPFYKPSYPNGEVNCTEPSPSVSVPWYRDSTVINILVPQKIEGITILVPKKFEGFTILVTKI